MRRFLIASLVAALLAFPNGAQAAGTVVVTKTGPGRGVTKYSIAWTSTAGGAVSSNTFAVKTGFLLSVKFVPGSAGSQPTDAYDVTLIDTDSVDLLAGGGANLSNATSTIQQWDPPLWVDGTQVLDLVVANAGNAKSGTVVLYVQ